MKKLLLAIAILAVTHVNAQTGFKAIKITTGVETSQGDTLRRGIIIVVGQIVIVPANLSNDTIPVSVSISTYKGKPAYNNGKRPFAGADLFGSQIHLKVPKADYTNGGFEGNVMQLLKSYFEVLYPANVNIVIL